MKENDIGMKMKMVFQFIKQVYQETALLMQTIEGLMSPDFKCPFDATGVWRFSYRYDAGETWLIKSVSRYWEQKDNPLSAALISIEFMPDLDWTDNKDVGPIATAMSLKLKQKVEKNNWPFWWRDDCGRNEKVFEVDRSNAPIYHSTLINGVEKDGTEQLLHSIANFWLPLSALTDQAIVDKMLVRPLKELCTRNIQEVSLTQQESYLYLPADEI